MELPAYILVTFAAVLLVQTKLSDASELFDEGEIVKCSGRCGEESNFPCSCHAKCFVRKNCCEDIDLDCPNLVTESNSQYGTLLDADVTCFRTHRFGVFMISSCPHGKDKRTLTRPSATEAEKEFNHDSRPRQFRRSVSTQAPRFTHKPANDLFTETDENRDKEQNSNFNAASNDIMRSNLVVETLKNVPVWDRSTRFSFLNSDVFLCHGGNLSNVVKWNVSFQLSDKDDVTDLQQIAQRVYLDTIVYKTPFDLYAEPSEICIPSAFGSESCDATTLELFPEIEHICNSYVSYVKLDALNIFRNRFCYYCKNGMDGEITPLNHILLSPTMRELGLSVTFSFNLQNHLRVNLQSFGNIAVLWADPTCNAFWDSGEDGKPSYEETLKCPTSSCEFEVRPDGECKTLHNTFIGFSQDNFPLTDQEEISLSQFLSCGMDKYLDIEIVEVNLLGMKQGNEFLNKSMIVVNTTTYVPSLSSLTPDDPTYQTSFKKLLLLFKAFAEYRKPPSESICQFNWTREKPLDRPVVAELRTQELNPLRNKSIRVSIIDEFYLPLSRNLSEEEFTSRETVVCVSSSPVILRQVNELYCMQGPVTEGDVRQIIDMCQSTCFSVFRSNLGVVLVSQKTLLMSTSIILVAVLTLLPLKY